MGSGYYRFELTSDTLYDCELEEAAAAGRQPGSAAKVACPGSTHGNASAGEALCGDAHEGVLCSRCKSEFYLDAVTHACLDCKETNVSPAVVVGIALIVVVAVIAAIFRERLTKWAASVDVGKARIVIFANLQVREGRRKEGRTDGRGGRGGAGVGVGRIQ